MSKEGSFGSLFLCKKVVSDQQVNFTRLKFSSFTFKFTQYILDYATKIVLISLFTVISSSSSTCAKVNIMCMIFSYFRQLMLGLVLSSVSFHSAQAQLWQSPNSTAAQSVLKGFKKHGNTLHKNKTKITLDVVANQVVGVLIEGPTTASHDMAYGVLAAISGTLQEHHAIEGSISGHEFLNNAKKGFKSPISQSGAEFLAVKSTAIGKQVQLSIYIGVEILNEKEFTSTKNTSGSEKAPNTIHILSDFQCPACRYLWDKHLSSWRKQPKKYRIYYHHFPLNYHKNAFSAAEASECAALKGKFWPFADQLFKQFKGWSRANTQQTSQLYITYAAKNGLNQQDFANCLKEHTTQKEVQRQMHINDSISITGTPTVYMNGIKLKSMSDAEMRHIAQLTSAQPSANTIIQKRLKALQLTRPYRP